MLTLFCILTDLDVMCSPNILFITDKYGIIGGSKQAIIDDRQIRLGGDVIISIDNTPVRKIYDILIYLQREKSIGEEVTLTVIRDHTPMKIKVILGERPALSETE